MTAELRALLVRVGEATNEPTDYPALIQSLVELRDYASANPPVDIPEVNALLIAHKRLNEAETVYLDACQLVEAIGRSLAAESLDRLATERGGV